MSQSIRQRQSVTSADRLPKHLTDELRRSLRQEFCVLQMRDGQVIHAGGDEMGGAAALAAIVQAAAPDKKIQVVSCGGPVACLIIPLDVIGMVDAVAAGLFRVQPSWTHDSLQAVADRLAVDLPELTAWIHRQPVFGNEALECLGQLTLEKLSAEQRVTQLDFEAVQLSEKIGENYEEISLLYQIVENVRQASSPDELAQFVLDWAIHLLPAEQAFVELLEGGGEDPIGGNTFVTLGQDHLNHESFRQLIAHVQPDIEGRPLVINAESTQSPSWPFPQVRELIVVPLRADRHNAGWLAVINHADGGWLGTHQARLLNAAATVMGMRVMMNEMSELRQAAEAASTIKSRILTNVSHELRTPLNGILCFSRLLLEGTCDDEEEHRDSLQTIEHCANRLQEVVDDLLEIQNLEAGPLPVRWIACRLDEVILGVVSQLQHRADQKKLTLEATSVAGTLGIIHSDPHRLSQLLKILVSNAIKFTERGEVRIESTLVGGANDRRMRIAVHDTGVGIPADKLVAIFDPFVQADDSTTRHHGGLGLGLAICRRLADSLGGTLTASNRPGGGSTFILELGSKSFARLQAEPDDQDNVGLETLVGLTVV